MSDEQTPAEHQLIEEALLIDLSAKLDAVQLAITDESGKREKEIVASNRSAAAAHRAAEASRKKSKRAMRVAIGAVLVAILSLTAASIALNALHDQNEERKARVSSICSGFEGLLNSLIENSKAPATDGERQQQLDLIHRLDVDFERRVSALNCHLHLVDPQPVSGG